MYNNAYINEGVSIQPNVISEGENVKLTYNGILAESGADEVWAHLGYADGSNWQDPSYVKMNKTPEGFTTDLNVNQLKNLNIVFKDSANNWDNNNGFNYVFDVQTR